MLTVTFLAYFILHQLLTLLSFMRKIFTFLFLFPLTMYAQNFPVMGVDSLLDIGTWNIEWFGNTQYGPTNEDTQFKNVLNVLNTSDIDIWGLEEVSNDTAYRNLMAQLSNYQSGISNFSQLQKMAILYKKSLFEKVNEEEIMLANNYDFGGRAPLMLTLKYKKDTTQILYVISIHMKANTGTTAQKADAYQRRKNAGDYLKTFLETTLKDKKYIVLGDWNDKLDYTIYNGILPSPYKQLIDANYFFETKLLVDKGKRTYYTGSVIDHIMISDSLKKFYIDSSIKVFDNASTYLSDFSNSTSDHYPVYGFYSFFGTYNKKIDSSHSNVTNIELNDISIFPNPVINFINIKNKSNNTLNICLTNAVGKQIQQYIIDKNKTETIDIMHLNNGLYFLAISNENGFIGVKKIIVE